MLSLVCVSVLDRSMALLNVDHVPWFVTDTEAINMEVTGNSHNSNADHKLSNKIPEEGGEEEGEETAKQASSASARKEKSVLQSKLTKLAIQIGYGGKRHVVQKSWLPKRYCGSE